MPSDACERLESDQIHAFLLLFHGLMYSDGSPSQLWISLPNVFLETAMSLKAADSHGPHKYEEAYSIAPVWARVAPENRKEKTYLLGNQ